MAVFCFVLRYGSLIFGWNRLYHTCSTPTEAIEHTTHGGENIGERISVKKRILAYFWGHFRSFCLKRGIFNVKMMCNMMM